MVVRERDEVKDVPLTRPPRLAEWRSDRRGTPRRRPDGHQAAWLSAAYGTSNEIVLEHDKETREWVNRHFPRDPHEPAS